MILALDQGTSSTKACIYEAPGQLVADASVPVGRQARAGRVSQDPQELVDSCREAARAALAAAGLSPRQLRGAALSNQGESFLLFHHQGGPITPVVHWQDMAAESVISALKAAGRGAELEDLTGLPLHALFSAPKLARELEALGELPKDARFGTLDTWLIHELSPDRAHVTDRATASRTMLAGLEDDDWNDDLLTAFGVPRAILPRIRACDDLQATLVLNGCEVPLLASCYDMGLALLGHGCVAAGDGKATFGTCLGVMTATAGPVRARGLLTTMAYTHAGSTAWALDGEISAAGALVSWAIRLGIASSLNELEAVAASHEADGVVLVPAIQGLGAPHWRDDVRAAFVGMGEETGRGQLARAVFDAIAWSLHDVAEAMRRAGFPLTELSVDGGLTHSRGLLQRCADVVGIPLRVCDSPEATAAGAAMLAMLAAGTADLADVGVAGRGHDVIEPQASPGPDERKAWSDALDRALSVPSPPA